MDEVAPGSLWISCGYVGFRSALGIFPTRLSFLRPLGLLRHVSIGLFRQDAALPKAR